MVGRRDGLDDGLEYNVRSITPEQTTEQLACSVGCPTTTGKPCRRRSRPCRRACRGRSDPRRRDHRDIDSPFLKAKAINDYFTDDTQGFKYS